MNRQQLRARSRDYVATGVKQKGRASKGYGAVNVSARDSAINQLNNNNLAAHAEQYNHNRGYVYAIVRTIAQRIAGQKMVVGRTNGTH